MFVAQQLVLNVSLGVASARLTDLAGRGGLSAASHRAYAGGLEHLIRVGPLGGIPGASKLVLVRFLDPVYRDDTMTIGLRWEATGVAGGLFPVLDSNLTLTGLSENATTLELAGSYRPPLGNLGAGLDKAVMSKMAAATIRALLHDVADSVTAPDRVVGYQPGPSAGLVPPCGLEPLTG
jgi:hypothetical protein